MAYLVVSTSVRVASTLGATSLAWSVRARMEQVRT